MAFRVPTRLAAPSQIFSSWGDYLVRAGGSEVQSDLRDQAEWMMTSSAQGCLMVCQTQGAHTVHVSAALAFHSRQI